MNIRTQQESAENAGGLPDLLLDDDDLSLPPRWGGAWTAVKLEALKKYLAAYTVALKKQRYRLLYIDAFAGTGECDVGNFEVRSGSASIALDVRPRFSEHIFIDRKAANCKALQRLVDERRYRAAKDGDAEEAQAPVRVIKGDANAELIRLCAEVDWKSTRAVLFLDPFAMSVDWSTLERIAATKAIDVWYLFPLNAVYRQLARELNAVDDGKRASLTEILGTEDWERDFYESPRVGDLFDDQPALRRHADWQNIVTWFTRRLGTIFARVEEPKVLRQGKAAPLFALYFAVSNPSPAAADLACRIAGDILRSDLSKVS
jgi:three-Cys-motif partner protein